MEKKHSRKNNYTKGYMALGVAVVLIGLFSIVQVSSIDNMIGKMLEENEEAMRPAEISIVTITDSGCEGCDTAEDVASDVRGGNVKILKDESFEIGTDQAQSLITKYGIRRVPGVLVFGETAKVVSGDLEAVDDALVFQPDIPPYKDTETGQVMGLVSATFIIDSGCDSCPDFSNLVDGFEETGIVIVSREDVERTSQEGQRLIKKYDISSIPSLLFSADMGAYGDKVDTQWRQLGTKESDGTYVLRSETPPYIDAKTGELVGKVTMIVLTDESCEGCFDAERFNLPILGRLGLIPTETVRTDVSTDEGKAYVSRYKIEKVPTIVLEGDPAAYATLTRAWKEVGTIEDDGTYVFRKVEIARQPYKDLNAGTVITPPIANS